MAFHHDSIEEEEEEEKAHESIFLRTHIQNRKVTVIYYYEIENLSMTMVRKGESEAKMNYVRHRYTDKVDK